MATEIIDQLKSVISEAEIIHIIKELVKRPSYPGVENQETSVALWIHDFFVAAGIPAEIIPVIDGRCNVIARLKGKGNGKRLMLTGHLDTVPPYDMLGDPFEVIEEDGKLKGRGVVDMKGPLACMIASMVALKRANIALQGDVIFAGVIDEENKSEGTIHLIESGILADAAIVGEPTELNICIAHRGLEWFQFDFQGKTVHGGKQKEGINAIGQAVKFIQRVDSELMPKIESKTHPIIGTSSMNYGLIQGGTQPSTVAGACCLQVDRRWVPSESYDQVVQEYQDILDALHDEDKNFRCTLKVLDVSLMKKGYVHEAMEIEKDHPIVDIVTKATEQITQNKPKQTYFQAWSDGGLLSRYAKIPTIVFAPGDLESAHSANEFLEISQIRPAVLIYAMTAIEFCR
ncbi:M20 family metallopeptidase [Fusibacter ferrireducens]|uniref:Probable succinyl-diaminopimelate desuccinylase n=1 Tax=Fusibacter ferrireducens TaxID=2785058 RepID=A0ABR9ZPP0_9FIRM|nr:M20 family metallopeptidase [Fusibacter ferrireducens]MBF4692432.1 M20 family metallopeptidase [Fusibacter ferrireducens]